MAPNIVGKKFNRLLVIDTIKEKGRTLFICKCDCGNTTHVRAYYDLKHDKTKSCGCLRKSIGHSNLIDLTRKRFGRLTVIRRDADKNKKPQWNAKCDCGNFTIVSGSHLQSGHTSSCGCLLTDVLKERKGPLSPAWTGGRHLDAHGYVQVCLIDHPSSSSGYVPEHRLIMESVIGRYLLPNENVHHINGVRHDNRPENLELWTTKQPKGQRALQQVEWALEILSMYPESIRTKLTNLRNVERRPSNGP
jgi:hypothetical protein